MHWIILAITFWGFFHSFNASIEMKDFFHRRLGTGRSKYYRLAYNAFSVMTFLPILIFFFLNPGAVLYRVPAPWKYLMIAGQLFFAACLLAAVFQFGILYFLGLRQLAEGPGGRKLVTSGLYGVVRHPFYTFFILLLWLTPSVTTSLLVVYLGLTLYIQIGIYFEERKLLQEFGDQYARYRAVTPALVPTPRFFRTLMSNRFALKSQSPDEA